MYEHSLYTCVAGVFFFHPVDVFNRIYAHKRSVFRYQSFLS